MLYQPRDLNYGVEQYPFVSPFLAPIHHLDGVGRVFQHSFLLALRQHVDDFIEANVTRPVVRVQRPVTVQETEGRQRYLHPLPRVVVKDLAQGCRGIDAEELGAIGIDVQ